ncbi:MAG: amino-acid N-acetyltransferase [Opitutales bacterium]
MARAPQKEGNGSAQAADGPAAIKPADLHGILKYVPLFREHTFVIALDGAVVLDENFANVMLDLAVLRSLQIHVVLVHGIGAPLVRAAEARGQTLSNVHGDGATDPATFALAEEVSAQVALQLMQGLTQQGLRVAVTNALRALEAGIEQGQSLGQTGKVDRVDAALLRGLLLQSIVPIVSPIAFDREGRGLRVNSDEMATELAVALEASKLIFLAPQPGLMVDGEVLVNVPLEELAQLLQQKKRVVEPSLRSKAQQAVRALTAGVPRAHLLDGRVYGCLLTEVFDTVGSGTMVHANEYQQIRPARKKDAQALFNITRNAVRSEALRGRTRTSIEQAIDTYFVLEVDESIIACACLLPYPGSKTMEIASVYVQPFYNGRGAGQRMVAFCCEEAARRGASKVVALTTRTATFFTEVCGFEPGTESDLPKTRREDYAKNGRNSRILKKVVPKPAPKRR